MNARIDPQFACGTTRLTPWRDRRLRSLTLCRVVLRMGGIEVGLRHALTGVQARGAIEIELRLRVRFSGSGRLAARSRLGVPGRRCAGHRRPRVLAWTAANARRFVPGSRRMRMAPGPPPPRSEYPGEDLRRTLLAASMGPAALAISAAAT